MSGSPSQLNDPSLSIWLHSPSSGSLQLARWLAGWLVRVEAAWYIMYPGQVDEAFGGQKAGAVTRTATFLIVLWMYLFERMRAAGEDDKEKASKRRLGGD